MKETIKKAGYRYIKRIGNQEHILENPDGVYEVWFSNKNHASYGLIFKNTHLEFSHSLEPKVVRIF